MSLDLYRVRRSGYFYKNYSIEVNSNDVYKTQRIGKLITKGLAIHESNGKHVCSVLKKKLTSIDGFYVTDNTEVISIDIDYKFSLKGIKLIAQDHNISYLIKGNFSGNIFTIYKLNEEKGKVNIKNDRLVYMNMGIYSEIGLVMCLAILLSIILTKQMKQYV